MIVSTSVKIKNNSDPTTEYIENELSKQGINALRWAIVNVNEEHYTLSVAYDKI